MNKISTFFVCSTLCATSLTAMADNTDKAYIGIQLATTTYTEDGLNEDFEPSVIIGRAGKFYTNNFAVEGRLGTGAGGDSSNGITLDMDSLIGVYALGHINLGETSSFYGVLGFSRVEGTFSALGQNASTFDSGVSYGVGVNIGVADNMALNIEYIQYLDTSDFDMSAISAGISYRF